MGRICIQCRNAIRLSAGYLFYWDFSVGMSYEVWIVLWGFVCGVGAGVGAGTGDGLDLSANNTRCRGRAVRVQLWRSKGPGFDSCDNHHDRPCPSVKGGFLIAAKKKGTEQQLDRWDQWEGGSPQTTKP